MKSDKKDIVEDVPLLSQKEAIQMLSDSLRFVHKKINGGRMRHNKKDISKVQWLKMQERLTSLYLSGLRNLEEKQKEEATWNSGLTDLLTKMQGIH